MPSKSAELNLFRLLVEQAPEGIIFADCEGVILVWNNAAVELFGYSCNEAIGQTADTIIHEHLRRAHWEGYSKALTTGQTKHGTRALKTQSDYKNGHKQYVSVAFGVVRGGAGNVIGAMATARELAQGTIS